jgi:hypothetical protein
MTCYLWVGSAVRDLSMLLRSAFLLCSFVSVAGIGCATPSDDSQNSEADLRGSETVRSYTVLECNGSARDPGEGEDTPPHLHSFVVHHYGPDWVLPDGTWRKDGHVMNDGPVKCGSINVIPGYKWVCDDGVAATSPLPSGIEFLATFSRASFQPPSSTAYVRRKGSSESVPLACREVYRDDP